MEKMFKYKMVNNNKCKRCENVETYKHLLWECIEAKKIWVAFNEFVTHLSLDQEKIKDYDDIFRIGKMGVLSKIKIRVIQEMIQIERPVNWAREKIQKIANEIKCLELYNATMINKLENTKRKWDIMPINNNGEN
jgi:hypothetical protein